MATQSYLPAAIRLVVQKLNQDARWHVTKSEIVLGTSHQTVLDETTESAERAEARYLREQAAIVKRFEELAADLEHAAARFGIDSATFGLADAANSIHGISLGMQERARTFLKATQQIQAATGGRAVDAAGNEVDAEAEPEKVAGFVGGEIFDCPAGIMADRLQDLGMDDAAAKLRGDFAGVPGQLCGPVADDETFSLAEADETEAV